MVSLQGAPDCDDQLQTLVNFAFGFCLVLPIDQSRSIPFNLTCLLLSSLLCQTDAGERMPLNGGPSKQTSTPQEVPHLLLLFFPLF